MSLEEYFKDVKEAEAYTKEYLNDILNKSIYEYYLIEKQTEQIEINRKINLFKNTKIKDILIKVDIQNGQTFQVYNKNNTHQNQYEFSKTEQFQPLIIEHVIKTIHSSYNLRKNMLPSLIKTYIEQILRYFCDTRENGGIKLLCENIIQYEINHCELKSMIEAQENKMKNIEEVIIRNNNEELSTKINNQEEIIEDFKLMIEDQKNQIKNLKEVIIRNNNEELSAKINNQEEIIEDFKLMIEAQENQIKNLKEVIIRNNNNKELSAKIDNQKEIIKDFKLMIEAQEKKIEDMIFDNHNFRITDEQHKKKIKNLEEVIIRNNNEELSVKIDNQEEILEDLALNKEQQEKKIDNQEEIIKDLIIYNQSLAFKNDKLEKKINDLEEVMRNKNQEISAKVATLKITKSYINLNLIIFLIYFISSLFKHTII
uniref:Uncharacterized protein n=1 Tax=viral metagenome TaxID=1070528 RepID=A0A6C0LFU2_9ZZZZ